MLPGNMLSCCKPEFSSTAVQREYYTDDIDVVVGKHDRNAWLDAVLTWNVRLDLEADSFVAWVTEA